MKKLVFLLIVAVVISGMVWGQIAEPGGGGPNTTGPSASLPLFSALKLDGNGLFDRYYAVQTISTESRYSAGIFSSMVDDFIEVNWFDPKIGTFAYLGGFPSNGSDVGTTNFLGAPDNISLGFGKTFKAFYLGVYYGGRLLTQDTSGDFIAGTGGAKDTAHSRTNWRNNTAILVGLPDLGAFRLDVILNTNSEVDSIDGNASEKTRTAAPSFALTWGGLKLAGLDPYVTIGYKFSDLAIWHAMEGTSLKTVEKTYNSSLGIQAGVNYDLDANSSVSGELAFGYVFGTSYSGDRYAWTNYAGGAGAALTGSGSSVKIDTKGVMGIGIKGGYKQTLNFGMVSVGFKPNVAFAYVSNGLNNYSGDYKADRASNDYIELETGINLGVKAQANRIFAVYTGAGLTLFDWRTYSHSGGSPKNKNTSWSFTGIAWDTSQFAGNYLGFGVTATPVENLVIGAGVNGLLNRFFTVNLGTMQVGTASGGDSLWGNNSNNFLGQILRVFSGITFDLTASYKF